jgi:hypothetical protein
MTKKPQEGGPAARHTPPPLPDPTKGTAQGPPTVGPSLPRVGKSTPPPLPPPPDLGRLDDSQATHLSDLLALVDGSLTDEQDDPAETSAEAPAEARAPDEPPSSEPEPLAAAATAITTTGDSAATNESHIAHLNDLLTAVNDSAAGDGSLETDTGSGSEEPDAGTQQAGPAATPARRRAVGDLAESELAHVDDLLAAVSHTMGQASDERPEDDDEATAAELSASSQAAPPPPKPSKPMDESLVAPVSELLEAAARTLDRPSEPVPETPPPPPEQPAPKRPPASAATSESLVVHVDELLASLTQSLDDDE